MPFRSNSSSLLRALCAAALLVPLAGLAHDTWLAASERTVQPGRALEFDMTSGDHFPVLGSDIDRARIEKSACRQGGAEFPLLPVGRSPKALRVAATPPAAGAVACHVQLVPRNFDLKPATVALYLDEIDAAPALREAWAASPTPKRWNETYTKNAKAIVPLAGGAVPPAAAGLILELVPGVELGAGRVAGPLPVTVLLHGKPLAGLSVALTSERKAPVQRLRTDTQGRVVFPAPAPGRWMLSATDLRPVDAAQGKWESQFSTLVFEILP